MIPLLDTAHLGRQLALVYTHRMTPKAIPRTLEIYNQGQTSPVFHRSARGAATEVVIPTAGKVEHSKYIASNVKEGAMCKGKDLAEV
jgi:hypothetical protein